MAAATALSNPHRGRSASHGGEGTDAENQRLAGGSSEPAYSSTKNTKRSSLVKERTRHTFGYGESLLPSRFTTWEQKDANETMDDFSIVFNLLADMSPAGVLPLSYGMVGTGYVPAVILLIVFALAAGYMMHLIGRTIACFSNQFLNYAAIWENVVGPGTAWIPTFIVILVCAGNCLAYACMFGDLFAGCMPAFGVTFATRTVCLIILGIFPLLPLCWLKDLSMLAPTSILAVIAVLYTLGVMVLRWQDGSYLPGGAYFVEAPPPAGNHTWTMTASSFMLINGLAIAFLCHYNGCKYYREFEKHTSAKFGARIALSFTLLTIVFATAMIPGYATFGGLSNAVILNNYSGDDMLANLARVAMGIANVCSFPLMFSGLREQTIMLIIFISPSMKAPMDLVWVQNSLSTVMLIIIMFVAILVTDCSIVVGLVGSICGSAIIYVLPCFLFDRAYTKVVPGSSQTLYISKSEQILVRVIGVMGVFLMFAGTIATVAL